MKKIIFCTALLCSLLINAQDSNINSSSDENQRTFLVEPYLMFPNMSGVNQIKRLPAVEVDANPGDIFGQLKFGGMLYFETTKNDWTLSSDFLYMHLAMGVEEGLLVQSGELVLKELLFEVSGLKRVTNWLEVGVGVRMISLKEDMELQLKVGAIGQITGGLTETWFDPVVILRSNGSFNEQWFYKLRGDLGGFGIGSDFTWQIQAYVGYNFSEKFHLSLGYRNIDIDYENGADTDYFKYDMSTFGPNLRAGFSW
ncbi:hypothetical protein [Urechidicola vernalis]|uniref:Outer membrane protein beta-barrel domain-containing protein n=1 Tax=Urechidicola vernalis TaxID=3075600 RepID=A0ABU2Y5E2_9FLAO|nr:hypothetical protein [Urechidicola sp. P050]MDT0553419.1 hypothetical protein [Urechidicola sp. P050]